MPLLFDELVMRYSKVGSTLVSQIKYLLQLNFAKLDQKCQSYQSQYAVKKLDLLGQINHKLSDIIENNALFML